MAINRISRMITRIRNRSERGAAAVEFAIGGGLLAVMAFGSAEYGLTLQKSHTLASAVRQASRVASTPCQNGGDCKTGNRPYDDFYVLRAAEAGMGEYWGQVKRVVIYKIVGSSTTKGDGGPPEACMSSATGLSQPTATPKAVFCNVYTKDTTFTNVSGGATLNLLKNLSAFEDPVTNGDNIAQLKATFGDGNDCGTGISKFFCPTAPPGNSTLRPRTHHRYVWFWPKHRPVGRFRTRTPPR
jgi:TadE-like protein